MVRAWVPLQLHSLRLNEKLVGGGRRGACRAVPCRPLVFFPLPFSSPQFVVFYCARSVKRRRQVALPCGALEQRPAASPRSLSYQISRCGKRNPDFCKKLQLRFWSLFLARFARARCCCWGYVGRGLVVLATASARPRPPWAPAPTPPPPPVFVPQSCCSSPRSEAEGIRVKWGGDV